MEPHLNLTRRERQIMDALYRRGEATVAEVRRELPHPPSYSAVRALLAKMQEKGHVTYEREGMRYVYRPTLSRDVATASALDRLIDTFFDGSEAGAIVALLDRASLELDDAVLDRLRERIDEARRGER